MRIIVKILKYCTNCNDRYDDYPRPIYYRNNIKFYAKTRFYISLFRDSRYRNLQ